MSEKFGLSREQHKQIARELYMAEKSNTPVDLLTDRYPDMTMDDAYAIQQEGLELRLADGAKIVGRKIGITSKGMMEMLHVDTPDYGCLLAHTAVPEGMVCRRKELNIPIVEGELAFIMGEDLHVDVVSTADVMNATAWVLPCFEICDARFPKWKVTVRDTISDNAGAARFMLGSSPKRIDEINPRTIGLVMEKNGKVLGSAAGVEVMGSPVTSVTWLANKLLEYGTYLKKGDIVLSGAFLAADPADAGDVYTLSMDGYPSMTLRFE
jgi:2-keto-4-pentenoate hydratase